MSELIQTPVLWGWRGVTRRKTPPETQCHYASSQTSSHCHFSSIQGANSICDELSDVLLGWVQRQCDRISYRQTIVAQYASLPAHRAFYVNYSMPLQSSSLEGNRLQRWIQRYRTMYTYSQEAFLTDSWNCLVFGCLHGLNSLSCYCSYYCLKSPSPTGPPIIYVQ